MANCRPKADQPWALVGPRPTSLGLAQIKIANQQTNMFYVYVLYSKKHNALYKGFSKNLKNRIRQHQNGLVKSTKHIDDWELVYYQAFINETDARREEIFLKSGKGRERLKFVLKQTLH